MKGSTLSRHLHAIEYESLAKKLSLLLMIRMIAACAHNRVMGAGGTLPWNIKEDWEYFLETTKDDVLLMGRRCYDDFIEHASVRKVVVLSRDKERKFVHAKRASNFPEGLKIAEEMGKDIWICGGEAIYREAMPVARELYLTLIDATFEGDVFFPHWRENFKKEISRREIMSAGKKLTFLILSK